MKYLFSSIFLAVVLLTNSGQLSAQEKNVPETVAESTDFKTLSRAIKVAGLAETLNATGPFTLFAPTDKAFASLPDGLLEALLRPENQASLRKILAHHVINGQLTAVEVMRGIKSGSGSMSVTSLEGADLTLSELEDEVFAEDGRGRKAKIKSTDLKASNGMIHIIDRVLLPGSVNVAKLLTSGERAGEVAPAPPPPPAPSLFEAPPRAKPAPVETVEIPKATAPPPPPPPAASVFTPQAKASVAPNSSAGHLGISKLSQLVSVLEATELLSTFSSGGQFTTFAPVNEAFDDLPAGSNARMDNILRYHLILAPISAAALTTALEKGNGFYQLTAMNGQTIIATLKSGKIQLMDSYGNTANLIQTDVPAGKGVMHLIDGVLLPR
ncbi:hypothetical protein CEQ90_13655 [Lewinellaceae bacterium SD302]|nr:hypothetical protein CEQ90_13655 [Lewinellaceae bacterium SD302]